MTTSSKASSKAPAKKAPAKKAAPRTRAAKPPAADPVPQEQDGATEQATSTAVNIEAFEALRSRASRVEGLDFQAESAPIVFGADWGFDPPLIARRPDDLRTQAMLHLYSQKLDFYGLLTTLIGPVQLIRVCEVFGEFPDGKRLLAGLALRMMDRVYGPSAGDVPGGTPASSTS